MFSVLFCYYFIVMQQDHRNFEVIVLSSLDGVDSVGQSLLILACHLSLQCKTCFRADRQGLRCFENFFVLFRGCPIKYVKQQQQPLCSNLMTVM